MTIDFYDFHVFLNKGYRASNVSVFAKIAVTFLFLKLL
jgi:hypothetical protein